MSLINKVLTELDRQEKIQPSDDFSLVRDNTRLITSSNKKKTRPKLLAGLLGFAGLATLCGWVLLENPPWLQGLANQVVGFRNTGPAHEAIESQASAAQANAVAVPDPAQDAGTTNYTQAITQTTPDTPIAGAPSLSGASPESSRASTSSAVTDSLGVASAAQTTPVNTSTTAQALAPSALSVATVPALPAKTPSPMTAPALGNNTPEQPASELRAGQAVAAGQRVQPLLMGPPVLPRTTPIGPELPSVKLPGAPGEVTTKTERITPTDVSALVIPPQAVGPKGEVELRSLINQDPQNAAARQALARILLNAKRTTEAADLLADGLMLMPDQLGLRSALAQTWVQTGQLNQALNLLQDGIPQGKNDPQYLTLYGHLLMKSSRYQEAKMQYLAAVQKRGSTISSWLGLATALQAEGDKNGAIRAYNQALSLPAINAKQKLFAQERLAELNGN